ncbi:MAG: pentapeptide repeat-containing protein [Cyanobacteria bacterium P01_G01_bin.19]
MTSKEYATKPIGQVLIEAGLVSVNQIEKALQEQKKNKLKIGEILVSHNWIGKQTVDFFVERWSELCGEEKKPLAYYFYEAGLLSKAQIKTIRRLQKLKQNKVRFHNLIVEEGYLKQMTVDFFAAYLLNLEYLNVLPLAKVYKILAEYAQEETDFQGAELCQAPLMNLSLPGIKLDGSNLKKADLSGANLSNSSLVQVNLSMANLSQAVLKETDFSMSFFKGSNLQESNLEKANFQSAILKDVNFRGANLANANFAGAHLKNVILPLHYSNDVYFDRETSFDDDFDPKLMGWRMIA